jgi:RNA polymerase sigma-70 factor (ECF subfamily)
MDPASSPQARSVAPATLVTPKEAVAHAPPDFEAIFANHFDYVWATLERLGVRASDVEDLAHDVFVSVHRRFADYDPSRPIRPWLFAFAFRTASDYRRLARHRREVLTAHEDEGSGRWPTAPTAPVATTEAPDAAVARGESEALVRAALETLAPERRAVFVLHELDECPVPELARALGIPMNTAYTRLRAARADFASAVQRMRRRGGGT